MPRTALGISGSSKTGSPVLPPVSADVSSGNSCANNGETILTIANSGVTSHTLAVQVAATVDGQPVNARTYTVTGGQTLLCGPFPTYWYGTTLLLNADSNELKLSALRPGPGIAAPAGVSAAFTLDAPAVIADLTFTGLTLAGTVLVVDTTATGSTLDGPVLVVTV